MGAGVRKVRFTASGMGLQAGCSRTVRNASSNSSTSAWPTERTASQSSGSRPPSSSGAVIPAVPSGAAASRAAGLRAQHLDQLRRRAGLGQQALQSLAGADVLPADFFSEEKFVLQGVFPAG